MKTRKPILITIVLMLSNLLTAQLIDGYTDKQSYRAGETVTFFTRSAKKHGLIKLSLQTINGENSGNPITFIQDVQAGMTMIEPWKNGYGYTATAKWKVPKQLKSGMYFIKAATPIPIIIKGDSTSAAITVVCCTNTDMAYTRDFHYSLNGVKSIGLYGEYDNKTPKNLIYSPVISFHRPITKRDFMDGFLKWFYNSNYSSINIISDKDLDDYSEINHSKLIIVIGHSEYWTRQARLNLDKFVEKGNNAMILSGNTMWWQVRYEEKNGNPQLICYRGKKTGYPQDDPICDSLLETTIFNKKRLKYSIHGSIGAAWYPYGGYCVNQTDATGKITKQYLGFKGYSILLPNSPFLQGTGLKKGDTLARNFQSWENGELDGAHITGYDAANLPLFNPNTIGFYRGEIIGYDHPSYHPEKPKPCAPILLLQRTCHSGKIINVNSNYWCRPSHFNQPMVQQITKNMIDLLLSQADVFVNPAPTTFDPTSAIISYQTCKNSNVTITPCGALFSSTPNSESGVFRIDEEKQGISSINCVTCEETPIPHKPDLMPTTKELMKIYANPNNGTFMAEFNWENQHTTYELKIYNALGILIESIPINYTQELTTIYFTDYKKGVYLLQLSSSSQETIIKKVVVE
jgi:hypothetical protein